MLATSTGIITRPCTAAADIAEGTRVKADPTYGLAAAGVDDVEIGVLASRFVHDGLGQATVASVILANASGEVEVIAAGAIAKDAKIYRAADGEVNDVAAGSFFGYALEAAADGDRFRARMVQGLPNGDGLAPVTACTANTSLEVGQTGHAFTTVGATGAVTFALPAAVPGVEYFFQVGAPQELRIDPDGTETISLPSTGVIGAAGKYLTANAAGETVHLKCFVTGTWASLGYTGTWTAEG